MPFNMKTHYALCDRGNESQGHDIWYETACGLDSDTIDLSDDIQQVDCRNCIRVMYAVRRKQITKSIQDYGIF